MEQQSAASIKRRRSDLLNVHYLVTGIMQGKKKGPSDMAKMCSSSLVDCTFLYAHINKVQIGFSLKASF